MALVKSSSLHRSIAYAFGSDRPPVLSRAIRRCVPADCGRDARSFEKLAAPCRRAWRIGPKRRRRRWRRAALAARRPRSIVGCAGCWRGRPDPRAAAPFDGGASGSASLGWHVDDIDVLLVIARGRRRTICYRSVDRLRQSQAMGIDHLMEPGHAPTKAI